MSRGTSALILVDIQPDFLPGGNLAVADGDAILSPLRELLDDDPFDCYVATQDWHPAGHVSFASNHDGRRPMDTIELYGHQQVLWPDHCVQGTPGAELHPELPWSIASMILRKGADPRSDSYSGFRNNWNPDGERPSTGLAGYLRERGVETITLCGLARDVCVLWTAEDGAAAGFAVRFVWDLTRGVDPSKDAQVRERLSAAGVEILDAHDL